MRLRTKYMYFLSVLDLVAAFLEATRGRESAFIMGFMALWCWFVAENLRKEEMEEKGDQ